MSWSSPYAVQIAKDKVNYDITEAQASYFSILPSLGMMITCVFFGKLTDVIGRKYTYLLIVIPQITFWAATIVSTNVYVLWVARFLSGFGDGCYFASFPVYVAEVSTPKVRGILGSAVTYFVFLGQLLANLIGYFLNVKECAYACIGFPGIFLILFARVPESPYYYVIKGRDNDAKRSLQLLSGKSDVEKEFLLIKEGVLKQMSESGKWKEIVTIKSNRKSFIAASILRIAQQLSGMPVFVVNTQLLFEKAGGAIDARVSSMIFAGLCFILYMLNGFVIDKVGRRIAEISSLLLCALATFLEAVYFYIDQNVESIDLSAVNWIPLAGLIAFVLFSALGVATVPTMMCGELFSAKIKSKAITTQIVIFGAFMSAVNYIFHIIDYYTGLYGPFAFFGTCNVVFSILCYFYIPETKGKTLEEIQEELKKDSSGHITI